VSRGAVYSAHRDTHFRFLKNVVVGDEIEITRGDGKRFRYRADAASVARFDNSGIDPITNRYELVLSHLLAIRSTDARPRTLPSARHPGGA
jgi:sortase (surface protein transpeptidase)